MGTHVDLNKVYQPSGDVVARDVHGEFIIIPITSGIGSDQEEIFALNAAGREIWTRLDGHKTLADVGREIMEEYDVTQAQMNEDMTGIVEVLLEKKMLVRG